MSSTSTQSAARTLLGGYYRAMLEKNADALADLYAEHAVHEFPLLTPFFPQRLNGREEIRKRYAAVWGASPIRIVKIRETALHETQDPSTVIAEAEYTADAQSSGKTFSLSFLVVTRIENNLIVHLRDYMDALGAAFALDRLPNLVEALKRKAS
jgi:ketosteroid isomerase-like protein